MPKPVRSAYNAAADVFDRVDGTLDAAHTPITAGRLRDCTLPCDAELTGLADVPRLDLEHGGGYEVALLRLSVARPEGEAECCVRQRVPLEARRMIVPGAGLRVMAHESKPQIAVVDWLGQGTRGQALDFRDEMVQFAWPDRGDWPAPGALEVRDNWRHRPKLEKRRREWSPMGARLVDARTRGSWTDGREDWTFELELHEARRVTVKQRAASIAVARLVAYKPGAAKMGGLVETVEPVVRTGAPIAVLVSPAGEVAIDWEATLRYPELRQPDPV